MASRSAIAAALPGRERWTATGERIFPWRAGLLVDSDTTGFAQQSEYAKAGGAAAAGGTRTGQDPDRRETALDVVLRTLA